MREFEEEFGAAIEPLEPIAETSFSHRGRIRVLAAWACALAPGSALDLREHLELRWCGPEEARSLPFVASDRRLLPHVLAWAARRGGPSVPPVE